MSERQKGEPLPNEGPKPEKKDFQPSSGDREKSSDKPGPKPEKKILSFDQIIERLEKLEKGELFILKKDLEELKREMGPANFKKIIIDLYVWAVKTKKDITFIKNLCSLFPGLSLELEVDLKKIEQVSFAYVQGCEDRWFLENKIRDYEIEGGKWHKERKKHPDDINIEIYLDTALSEKNYAERDLEKLKQLLRTWGSEMGKYNMDYGFEEPADWADKFK